MPHAVYALCFVLIACLEEQRYHVVGETVVLTADAQPTFVVEDEAPLFRVDRAFSLRITPPSEATLADLARDASGSDPRGPWVALHDLALQVDYALENGGDTPVTALVTLDGINEFRFYAPGPEDLHQWERRIALAPFARATGHVSELELDEIAIDLATVANGAPSSNLVVARDSQSSRDPRVRPYLPSVVPGLVGLRAGIQTQRAASLTLALSIRVADHGARAQRRGDAAWSLPTPVAFTPRVPDPDE